MGKFDNRKMPGMIAKNPSRAGVYQDNGQAADVLVGSAYGFHLSRQEVGMAFLLYWISMGVAVAVLGVALYWGTVSYALYSQTKLWEFYRCVGTFERDGHHHSEWEILSNPKRLAKTEFPRLRDGFCFAWWVWLAVALCLALTFGLKWWAVFGVWVAIGALSLAIQYFLSVFQRINLLYRYHAQDSQWCEQQLDTQTPPPGQRFVLRGAPSLTT